MEGETSERVALPQLFVTQLPTSPACTHQNMQTIRFRHAHFTARLPVDYRYTPSHFWLLPAPAAAGENLLDLQGSSPQAADQAATEQGTLWRVGFTKFATRMLGELVEMVLEVEPGQAITPGSRLGSVEGFKAVSDLFSVIDGTFGTRNPLLTSEACLTHSDPYERGWLYTACGEPEPGHLDVHGYIAHLTTAPSSIMVVRPLHRPGNRCQVRLQGPAWHDASKTASSCRLRLAAHGPSSMRRNPAPPAERLPAGP